MTECSKESNTAILLTFIKLPFVIKIFVLSIFEWPLKTGIIVMRTVDVSSQTSSMKMSKELQFIYSTPLTTAKKDIKATCNIKPLSYQYVYYK